mmetsp:Transcript_20247/g.42470  ORF Transcript_20247/g.42470 Transcript_20247/m.42470 type:complete len:148 (+) Transcript_20247:123-566(+)
MYNFSFTHHTESKRTSGQLQLMRFINLTLQSRCHLSTHQAINLIIVLAHHKNRLRSLPILSFQSSLTSPVAPIVLHALNLRAFGIIAFENGGARCVLHFGFEFFFKFFVWNHGKLGCPGHNSGWLDCECIDGGGDGDDGEDGAGNHG